MSLNAMFLQPSDRLFQSFRGFCFKDASGISAGCICQPVFQIDFSFTQCKMVLRRSFRSVVNVKVNQGILMLQNERYVLFA